MKTLLATVIITLLAANAIAQTDAPKDPNRERLGIRTGYVGTSSDIDNSFGGGLNLALHYIQRIKKPFAIDFTLGAFYLGSSSRVDITRLLFGPGVDDASMRIITFTVMPMIEFPLNDRTHFFVGAGGGLYTLSVLLDSGFFQGDVTDNHVGVNGGAGLVHRITTNWFLDATVQVHKFYTGKKLDDLFFRYSEGDEDPLFFDISVGAMLRLF